MKVLVILAVAGVCAALPQGFLSDTPEVIAERQKFFQLYNAAAAAARAAPDDNEIPRQATATSSFHEVASNPRWVGPLASSVPAGVNGNFAQVQDTAEVAAARQAFDNAFQQQLRATSPGSLRQNHVSRQPVQSFFGPEPQASIWTGPVAATIPAGLPGSVKQVPNTPEVERAIAEFTRAYNSAVQNTVVGNFQQRPSFFSSKSTKSTSHPTFSHPNAIHEPSQPRWTGPFAATIPAGLPGSVAQVQDTPEVAAAKAQFQRAFQQQLVYSG